MGLLNKNNLKTLVAIGSVNKQKQFVCEATGFLIGFLAKNSINQEKKRYFVFLITNRHVFEGKNNVYLRLNKLDGKSMIVKQDLSFSDKQPRWLSHKNKDVDLAMLTINATKMVELNFDFTILNEEMFAFQRDFENIGIQVGDSVYILGFPMGLAGKIQNFPYVKGGLISRFDKELIKFEKAFLIDSSIFPGNSGSPVILRPEVSSINGSNAVSQIYVLGVVSRYLPYEERLYSLQTTPPSVVSLERENSGLSFVVPMEFAKQIFNRWRKRKLKLEKADKNIPSAKLDTSL